MTEVTRSEDTERSRSRYAIWGREIPFRNPHFTGRERELAELRRRLIAGSAAVIGQPALPLYGLGGIGKTEMAAEYAHRFREEYGLVWWIRCERKALIQNALLSLGRAMRLPDFQVEERDYSVGLVMDALSMGEPFGNWLLIFDNATNAEMVGEFIPQGGGHVIITSRDTHWRKALRVEGIELGEFATSETVDFLYKRVPALAGPPLAPDASPAAVAKAEAEREQRRQEVFELAAEVDNLPLAAEHAAAYLAETGTPVSEYLELFRSDAHRLLGMDLDITYPQAVATTWSVSRRTISTEANALFRLLAFFAPEPISEELLLQPGEAAGLPDPLNRVLSGSTQFRRATRELARFSLAKINPVRNVIQIHRVVQAVTKGQLMREDPDEAAALRSIAHRLLAASDPNAADRDDSEEAYERSRQHLVPSGALESDNELVRRLVINQVRRLHRRGGYAESLSLGELAFGIWQEKFEPNDRRTLALAVEIGIALRRIGRVEEALQLNAATLDRLRESYGEEDQIYLTCAASYSVNLQILGRYAEALDNDLHLLPLYERVFGPEHLETHKVRNNIGVSLRCLGRYDEALQYDEETLAQRDRILGGGDTDTLSSRLGIARDLRMLGQYERALDTIRHVNDVLVQKAEPWNHFRLIVLSDLAVSLRRAGYHAEAAEQSELVLRKCIDVRGERHRETLRTATNVINDRRLVDELASAQDLGERTAKAWAMVAGTDHPNTVATAVNLALVLRQRGNPGEALAIDEQALKDLRRVFGDSHPSTLVAMTNLASDLAAVGEAGRARELGERALTLSREVLGADHPYTLATATNLSVDRRADGDADGAHELHADTMARYNEALTPEHPDVRLAAQFGRVNLDIELMMN